MPVTYPGTVASPNWGQTGGGMYDPWGRRRGAKEFGQPNNDPTVIWNLTGGKSGTPGMPGLGPLPPGSSPGIFPGAPGQGQTVGFEPWQMKSAAPTLKTGGDFPQQPPGLPAYFTGSPSSSQPANPNFTLNPQPHTGTGPFGQVPGPLGLPNPSADLRGSVGNLPQLNEAASSAILSNLHGELSPATQAAIQDAAARFGISSGMPGSGLAANRSLRDIGLASEQVRAQGLQQYNPFINTVSNTQTVRPETQIGVAETNSINAAAPDPQAQSSYAEQLFAKYLAGVNPAGGTGAFATRTPPPTSGGGGVPPAPFSPITGTAGGAARPTWQSYPWQGNNVFANDVNWGPQSYWKGR